MDAVNENALEKWVNLKDIAEYLSVSEDTVRTWVRKGDIPFSRAGKRYKFKISEVEEWMRSSAVNQK